MSDAREPLQHGLATSDSDEPRRAHEARPAYAISLLSYAQALQEYLEEQLPGIWPGRGADKPSPSLAGHLVALDALGSVTSLLTAIGTGKQVDAAELTTVLTEAKAAFAESGMLRLAELASSNSQSQVDATDLERLRWSVPEWCVGKLCRGMEELSSGVADDPETEARG